MFFTVRRPPTFRAAAPNGGVARGGGAPSGLGAGAGEEPPGLLGGLGSPPPGLLPGFVFFLLEDAFCALPPFLVPFAGPRVLIPGSPGWKVTGAAGGVATPSSREGEDAAGRATPVELGDGGGEGAAAVAASMGRVGVGDASASESVRPRGEVCADAKGVE